jgi:hypothetical protein
VNPERVCDSLDGPMGDVIREAGRAERLKGRCRPIEAVPLSPNADARQYATHCD